MKPKWQINTGEMAGVGFVLLSVPWIYSTVEETFTTHVMGNYNFLFLNYYGWRNENDFKRTQIFYDAMLSS